MSLSMQSEYCSATKSGVYTYGGCRLFGLGLLFKISRLQLLF